MITRIEGTLERAADGAVELRCGDIAYEILVPACDEADWMSSIGSPATLHTLHYLEGQGQGASFWPRLIGFRRPEDRAFFDLFTTVKGIGMRRALRAMAIPPSRIAEAIVVRDTALLMSLPEIGKKTAETMVLELRDKVAGYAMRAGADAPAAAAAAPRGKGARAAPAAKAAGQATPTAASGRAQVVLDAVAVLVQLGESRLDAREMVDRALERDAALASADAVVASALAARQAAR